MRGAGTTISFVGHAALLTWGLVSFAPDPFDEPLVETIPIEFVTISEVTDVTKGVKTAKAVIDSEETTETPEVETPKAAEDPGPAEKPAEEPKPEPVKEAAKKPVEATPPEPKAEPVPEPPKPEPPKPEPVPTPPPPKPEPVVEPPKPEPVKEVKPEPEPPKPIEVAKAPDPSAIEELIAEEKTPDPSEIDKLIAEAPKAPSAPAPRLNPRPKVQTASAKPTELLDKKEPKSSASGKPKKKASVGTKTGRKGAPLTQSELDGLSDSIKRCWNLPQGYTAGNDFQAKVQAKLAKDGSVIGKVKVLSVTGFSGGNSFLIKNAVNVAIKKCAPYKLPAAKYDEWKDLVVNFHP